jgi:tRNA A22 N-methylase
LIDSLEEKVRTLQTKIGATRQWNFHQMALLEERENNLEACIMEITSKQNQMSDRAKVNEVMIKSKRKVFFKHLLLL